MNRFNCRVGKTFLYLSPISIGIILIAISTKTSLIIGTTWYSWPLGILVLSWLLSGFYFMITLLFSADARDVFLVRLANIQERDEREEQIVGRASRNTFLFMLAVLITLLFASTARYGRSVESKPVDHYQSFTIGHLELTQAPFEIIQEKSADGKEEAVAYYDIPLSKAGLILVLIFLQLCCYVVSALQAGKRKALADT